MKISLGEGSDIPAMPLFQRALALGLAPRDQVFAHEALSGAYREIVGNSGLAWRRMVEQSEFRQCMIEIEKAFELDRAGSLGFFSEPLHIGSLKQVDVMYTLAARLKQEQEGTEAAISYLVGKLRAVEYLARPPLLQSLIELGKLYIQAGNVQDATTCLQKVIGTKPLYPADKESNSELCETARQMLQDIQGQISGALAGYCTRCGKPIAPRARFCTSCGAPVNASTCSG